MNEPIAWIRQGEYGKPIIVQNPLHQILGYEGVAVGQDYLDECVAELRKAQEK